MVLQTFPFKTLILAQNPGIYHYFCFNSYNISSNMKYLNEEALADETSLDLRQAIFTSINRNVTEIDKQ